MKSAPLTVYLADLTHTGIRIANEAFPLNIGLLASYAQKKFGAAIRVRLFKYPERLLAALEEEPCDILACSNYVWNDQLSEWAFRTAKSLNPETLTVRGGPNFPLEPGQQESYLRRHPATDVYCLYEGELAFAQVIERVLSLEERPHWRKSAISGCLFLAQGGGLCTGEALPRLEALDEIPSPYTSGLLDQFFDGNLTPLIATTRGCPFTCNYCNAANPLYNRVTFFSAEYVEAEIDYIAGKVSPLGITNLTLSDNNFGMYPRDRAIAQALHRTQREHKWPLAIIGCTGKNNVAQIVKSTEMLGDALTISMSVQSMDPNTLKIIERDNIKLKMYGEIAQAMELKGRPRVAELIVPLPEENFKGYLDGIGKLVDLGANSVVSYTLALSNGTVYTGDSFREKYGYRGKFRVIPNDFGSYGGTPVFDYEEVATSSSTLSFAEYLEIRKFALITELLFNNSIFTEVTRFLKEHGLGMIQLMTEVLNRLPAAPEEVRRVFEHFVEESVHELKDDEASLVAYYSDPAHFERLTTGAEGGNIIYKHKGMMLVSHMDPWIDYICHCTQRLIEAAAITARDEELPAQLDAIGRYISGKLSGIFDNESTARELVATLKYDVDAWLKSAEGTTLASFRTGARYRFYYDKDQQIERNDLFGRYTTDVSGLSKIMARLMSLDRIFRKVAVDPLSAC